ncbi:MAG: chaperone NapD [Gammaproteobacteria bacterium]
MNTVGILVQYRPEQLVHVRQLIVEQGCEVHLATPEGKMVVTLEHASDSAIADTIVALQNISGVLTALPVYHHHDSFDEELS